MFLESVSKRKVILFVCFMIIHFYSNLLNREGSSSQTERDGKGNQALRDKYISGEFDRNHYLPNKGKEMGTEENDEMCFLIEQIRGC